MLNFLSDNLAIAVLLLVTLLVLVLLAVVISAALRSGGQAATANAGSKLRLLGSESLRLSFRHAIELIEANLAERAERYNLSWTLLLNESTGRAVPLAQSGLSSALSADSSLTAAAQGIAWNFFDKGVVVQLQSEYLGSPDPDSAASNGIWDDFLGLCRAYRPQRPFDGIVLAMPCAALLASDPQGQLELVARAKAIHRRLWLAQNRLALRFPIHLVVTECEVLPGFSTFGVALPEPMRRSILGWASPYELVAPFRVQWVDAAMDQIVGAVADSCAELCALEQADADSRAYFLLPSEVERLRAGLKVFCEELMRPSAYHEPFLLRGIYLTGDCSDEAALLAATAGAAAAPALTDGAEHTQLALAGAGAQDAAVAAPQDGMPVFLRDIFERKIFAEVGLVQASSQRMRRPAVGRLAYWSALLLPALWALGLIVSSFQLHRLAGEMIVYLDALNGDDRASLQSGRAAAGWTAAAGGAPNAQRSQQRAVDALLNIEQLGEAHFSSLFMPGSWPIFDDLHDRVQQRLEQGFADNAFEALRRAAFAQLSQLTGVPRDPATGSLIAGAQCTLPARWHEQAGVPAPSALNLEDLPHYLAMLQYLARMDELDRVVSAMLRLKGPSSVPASGDDLALVVRVLLGTELNGTPARTAALFREVAQNVPSLAIEPMQEAARCSLHLASGAMYRRLFDENGLLRAEQAVAASTGGLFDGVQRSSDLDTQLRQWQTLRAALDAQQSQLMVGKGGWMHQSNLNLGAAHDAMLERIGANSLLGKVGAQDSRQLATQGFGRFVMAWDATLAAPNPVDAGGPGLAWAGATASWAFTPERKALHEAVSALMAPPYMRAETPVRLPDVPAGATIRWDKAQLERAASLAEARKAFQAGPYTRLPSRLQQPASALVDQALAGSVHGALAQALTIAAAELPSAASDADYASVLRVRARLEEMGARQAVAEVDTALARDAMSRLRRLDEVFTAGEVFVPRDRAFQGWKGEKGALVEAFAAGDGAGLNAYLAQQQEFIEILGKQVEGVLTQLSGAAASQPLVARWQAILADLRRYRLKSPTSSLLAVEQFILNGSADIDLANCADKLGARMAQRRGADVFAERLHGLQSGLLARCRELSASHYQGEWERFAEVYNRDLGRRLPFVALSGAAGTRGRASDAVPADREEVGAVMKLYERASAASAQAEREPGRPAVSAAVRKANLQLRRVRDVLAPLYPAEEGQAGGLDVTAQFRANPGAEAEGNKIIEWTLSIGGASVRQNEAPRALRWEPGMAVLLSMRLARDGTGTPKADAGQPHMAVAERTVSYRFDDPWALFSFIGAYREEEAPGSDGRAPLLRFEFPLANTDATGRVPAADSRARVFVRLAVSAPGKRTPLAWPAVFPVQAPAWQEAALPATGGAADRLSMQADRGER
ncbi:type VI secretion system protein [Janthinobacterium sp. SUN118]|uniref:type VI secretion system protein n=1 Tax=Janthinobacterium sp. SUN118 TaxID=3004100 RepID=UPI0025B253C3|nr:type VI secretion system protein [Janthinobacterium sp. SUN118]MDN2710541.1 type VI secretion system protein [Janthinobacterium sp. SUN118]